MTVSIGASFLPQNIISALVPETELTLVFFERNVLKLLTYFHQLSPEPHSRAGCGGLFWFFTI